MNRYNEDNNNYFLFKIFITGKFFIPFLKNIDTYNYSVMNDKYNEYLFIYFIYLFIKVFIYLSFLIY